MWIVLSRVWSRAGLSSVRLHLLQGVSDGLEDLVLFGGVTVGGVRMG